MLRRIYCFFLSLALVPVGLAEGGNVSAEWQACAANPQYQCVLALAQQETSYPSNDVLADIARAQAEAGKFNEAIITTKEIDHLGNRAAALSDIAKVQAQSGNLKNAKITFDDAVRVAQQHPDEGGIRIAIEKIAVAQAEAGNFSDAIMTAQKIDQANGKAARDIAKGMIPAADIAIEKIAAVQIETGNFNNAIKATQQINSSIVRSRTLKDIAVAQAKARDINAAATVAQQADIRSYHRSEILASIAIIQTEEGSFKDAISTVYQIDHPNSTHQAEALADIARAQAQAGYFNDAKINFDDALSLAHKIDDRYRTETLGRIAVAQAGYSNEAKINLDNAILSVLKIKEAGIRINSSADIVRKMISLGNFQDAKMAMKKLNLGDYFHLLNEVANAQTQTGSFGDAIITALQVKKVFFREQILINIAAAQAKAGNFNDAKNTAQLIGDEFALHTHTLKNIAIAQAESGDFKGAMQTVLSINDNDYYGREDKILALANIAKILAKQ